MNRLILTVLLLVSSAMGFSAKPVIVDQSKSPLGCRDLGYQFELNVLSLTPAPTEDNQFLFFVYNQSNRPINLYQMMKQENSSRSVGLNNVIYPGQWGALATSAQDLKFMCSVDATKSTPGQLVNCADNLKVCEYARVKFGMNNRGNYWIVRSNSRGGAVNQVLYYGIIPR